MYMTIHVSLHCLLLMVLASFQMVILAESIKLNERDVHAILSLNQQTLLDLSEEPQASPNAAQFDWVNYHDINEINAWLYSLADQYPDIVEVIVGGKTFEGRNITGVKVSYKDGNPGVFLEAGVHSDVWIGPATATWILNELLTSQDDDVRFIAENYDWYIIPSVNPDGYQYTHTNARAWRKSRKPSNGACFGTDLNRNWDVHWGEVGKNDFDACSNHYSGSGPFSEVETSTLADYLMSLKGKIQVYLDFHNYGQLLMFPYAYSVEHVPEYDTLLSIASKSAESLANRYGTRYRTGNIAETTYVASGSSADWVYINMDVKYTFVYELRDTGRHGFLLPKEQIIPSGEETLDSVITILQETYPLIQDTN